MKITDINYTQTQDRVRSSARIVWEDTDRAAQEIYFETIPEFSQSISPDPHSFVIAAIFPALYFGEKRLHVDQAVCPKLKDGLVTAMNLLRYWWYPQGHPVVSIEAETIDAVTATGAPKQSAFCFSGGVDSLATLYHNRNQYPDNHPGSLKDGLLVYGMEINDIDQFEKVIQSNKNIAAATGLTFVPLYTNMLALGPKNKKEFWRNFWLHQFMNAAFGATAHAFSKRWNHFVINSSRDIPHLAPHGSHPLLTACCSSWNLDVKEEGINWSRQKKVESIAQWDVALNNLRVCNQAEFHDNAGLNCGQCEKCIRTMLAFEAAGTLHKAKSFPVQEINDQMVFEYVQLTDNLIYQYKDLISVLLQVGRRDLSHAIEHKIAEFYRRQRITKLKNKAIDPIIEFDKKYLNSTVKTIIKTATK